MGASGYRDHIVVCGWNSTARELIAELGTDEYTTKVVVIHDAEKNPAGSGVYFVSGDITDADDLRRAGIEEAMAAIICPADASNDADMRSILCVMAIEAIAPQVRTVVEVNNPGHVDHFHRANVDEIVVTSRIASRLLARSSLYPGLAEIVTDIVSGGKGSELYRVAIPDECVGLSLDELSARLRGEHSATLLGVNRDGDRLREPAERLPAGEGRRRRRRGGVAGHPRAAGDPARLTSCAHETSPDGRGRRLPRGDADLLHHEGPPGHPRHPRRSTRADQGPDRPVHAGAERRRPRRARLAGRVGRPGLDARCAGTSGASRCSSPACRRRSRSTPG